MDIIQQITTIAEASVNPLLVIVLMTIGAVFKHLLKKLDNDAIPVLIILSGIIINIVLSIPFNVQDKILLITVQGIISGAVATGLHSQGKTIWGLIMTMPSIMSDTIQDTTIASDKNTDKTEK